MATASEVQSLYIAYFGRPADSEGLTYWTVSAGSSTPLSEIATGFASTAEFLAVTQGRPISEVISTFYQNLFNRPGEPDGISFWVEAVLSGRVTIEAVGLNIAQAALLLPPGNTDRISEESKISAANQFTAATAATTAGILAYTGENGILAGRTFLAPVVSPATTPSAAQTDAFVAAFVAGGGGGSNVLDLTTNQDVFTALQGDRINAAGAVVSTSPFRFTNGDQIVNGTAATFNVTGPAATLGDTLEDPSTTDSDTLTITNISNLFSFAGSNIGPFITVTNIENVNLGLSNTSGVYNFFNANWSGVQSIVATGSIAGTTANPTTFDSWASGTDATSFDSSNVNSNAVLRLASGAVGFDLTVTTGATSDRILTSNGNDSVNSGAGRDIVDTGLGADTVVLGAGPDTFVFNLGDGGGTRTSFLSADGAINNGDTFNFNGTIDRILDFNQTDDTLNVSSANSAVNLANLAVNTDVAFNQNFFIRGDFAGTTFRVNNAGADTLVLASTFNVAVSPLNGANPTANSSNYFVLEDFTTPLATGNFV